MEDGVYYTVYGNVAKVEDGVAADIDMGEEVELELVDASSRFGELEDY